MGADKRPEELFNYYAKAQVGARKIANAIGFFALLWSTAVLLGGFVGVLRVKDFWFLSLLSLLMASKILEFLNINVVGIYAAERQILRLTKGKDQRVESKCRHWARMSILSTALYLKKISSVCIWAVVAPSAYAGLALSVVRLVQRDYGDAGGDAANKVKLNAALTVFYVLVIFQSLSFLYYAYLTGNEPWMLVSKKFEFGVWGPKIVRRYRRETRLKCRKDGVLPNNWNLITFSVGLLESTSQERRLWGARVLDTFIRQGILIRHELLSSSQALQNLIYMIIDPRRTDDPAESRERAARIVADLASELHITQFPDVLRCICCLLESCKQYSDPQVASPSENSEQTNRNLRKLSVENIQYVCQQEDGHLSLAITEQTHHKHKPSGELPKEKSWIQTMINAVNKSKTPEWDKYFGDKYHYSYASKGTKELISQGLVILEGLTQDEDNCIEIIRHQKLLSKITLSLSYHPWGEILTVVNRLISAAPGEDTLRLRHDISSNAEAVHNLMRILEHDNEGARRAHERTIEILTELSFDDSFRKLALTEMFVKTLRRIFLEDSHNNVIVDKQDEQKYKRVRRKAGEALARLLRVPNARDSMTSATNVYVVDLLPKHDVIDLLTKVVERILSSMAKKAADVTTQFAASNSCPVKSHPTNGAKTSQTSTQEDGEQDEERKLLAAMLSLTVAICNQNVITRDEFTCAIPDDVALVKKLKEIVEMEKNATTDGWRILKLVCEVVIATVQLKPSCMRKFNMHSFNQALYKGLKTMFDVDDGMAFAGNDREVPAKSLSSLVKEVHKLLAEEQGEDFSN